MSRRRSAAASSLMQLHHHSHCFRLLALGGRQQVIDIRPEPSRFSLKREWVGLDRIRNQVASCRKYCEGGEDSDL